VKCDDNFPVVVALLRVEKLTDIKEDAVVIRFANEPEV
jgi:hypothetical protein